MRSFELKMPKIQRNSPLIVLKTL